MSSLISTKSEGTDAFEFPDENSTFYWSYWHLKMGGNIFVFKEKKSTDIKDHIPYYANTFLLF